jgi:hypothetical protein
MGRWREAEACAPGPPGPKGADLSLGLSLADTLVIAGDLEAAPFHNLLFDRNCLRHVRLVSRARLGLDSAGALGVLLVSADIRLAGRSLYSRTANHEPENHINFQRKRHYHLPLSPLYDSGA